MVFLRRNDLTLLVLTAVIAMALPAFAQADAAACRTAVKGLQTELVDFPSSGVANFKATTVGPLPATPFETVVIDGHSYLTFVGSSSPSDSNQPHPLFTGYFSDPFAPELELIGIKIIKEGDQYRWYIPTIETLNILSTHELASAGLGQIINANGADSAITPDEVYWRAIAQNTILISVTKLGLTSHDMVDHYPGYLLLAKHHSELWIQITDLLKETFGFLDGRYPDLKGKIPAYLEAYQFGFIPEEQLPAVETVVHSLSRLMYRLEADTPNITVANAEGHDTSQLEHNINNLELALEKLKVVVDEKE